MIVPITTNVNFTCLLELTKNCVLEIFYRYLKVNEHVDVIIAFLILHFCYFKTDFGRKIQ